MRGLFLLLVLFLLVEEGHATIEYQADALAGRWSMFTKLAFAWKGTVLPKILSGPMFWFVMTCHIVCVLLDRIFIWNGDYANEKTRKIMMDDDGNLIPQSFFELLKYEYANCQSNIFTLLPMPVANFGISLVFFFVVFYNGNCYSRFYTLYGHTVGIGGQLMEWTAIAKSNLPDDPMAQWNSIRHMLAAQSLLYYMLSDDDGEIDPPFWKVMQDRQLLTVEESELLSAYKGFKPFLAIYWALAECKHQLALTTGTKKKEEPASQPVSPSPKDKSNGHAIAELPSSEPLPAPIPPETPLASLEKKMGSDGRMRLKKKYAAGSLSSTMAALERVAAAQSGGGEDVGTALRCELVLQQLREKAFAFRGHCGQIVNALKQPVPYPYFHLLNLILMLNLLLAGWAFVILAWWPFTVLVIGIVTIVLLGIHILAVQLSDPFGDDSVDFEIEQFLKGSYVNSVSHLQSPRITKYGYDTPDGIVCPINMPSSESNAFHYKQPGGKGTMGVVPAQLAWHPKPSELGPSRFGFTKS